MKPLRCVPVAMFVLLISGSLLYAHPGHNHPPNLRVWQDAEELFEIEASFVQTRENRVQLCKHDGTLVWVPLDRLSRQDQAWVRKREEEIRTLNQSTPAYSVRGSSIPSNTGGGGSEPQPSRVLGASLAGVGMLVSVVLLALILKRRRAVVPPVLILLSSLASLGLAEQGPATQKEPPAIQKHFEPFKNSLTFRWDDDYFYVGSAGFPDHPMMVGIKAWQQQVPLPQPYTGKNAWQIPLRPRLAEKPISAKTALFSGAIAVAVNGVPIFNALNNRGEDAFLVGELDEYGGHCGRGDDYHYHAAPVHLEKVVGKGKPIAYALDGFAIYGYTDADGKEPKDLDEFNGRTEKDGYRYYSTRKYPYINGGMRGAVTVRRDRIEPQPRDAPVRPAGKPLRGAKITDFTRDGDKRTYTLKYDLRGQSHAVKYTINQDGTYTFVFTDAAGKETTETYRRRGPKK